MSELIELKDKIDPEILEPYLLSASQAECPVVHHFGPGVYVREVTIPAGALAMGHKQRFEVLNIVLKGSVAIIDDGSVKVISAPTIFVGKPGRKLGYCIEECVWQNVYANPDNERDIETLEERYLDKSEFYRSFQKTYIEELGKMYQEERDDYARMLSELGFTEDQVRAETEISQDMVNLPEFYAVRLSVRESPIEGKGLFLSHSVKAGEMIAPARIAGRRTIAGRYVNHSHTPNCKYELLGNDVMLVAIKDITGAVGGSCGDELTADYRQALVASGRIGGHK
jgi:hypothetical protein